MGSRRLVRKSNAREEQKFIYIFTEGKKTEPNYFSEKKSELKNLAIKIVINPGNVCGMCTMGLVDAAINYIEENKDSINLNTAGDGDECWVVFDYDDFRASFDNAIDRAQKHGLKVAYSNDSFELWYVLHFREYSSSAGRSDYKKVLNKEISDGYDKRSKNLFSLIKDQEPMAIKRAKKLEDIHVGTTGFSKRNPSTKVYELVERLNSLK